MEFLNPWGLLSLLAVPALVALYILRQKHKEVKIPSLLLWKKTQTMMVASTPWQKLKKNLLFILQLLAVILVALAISRPALKSSRFADEIIVIIDSSASMRAEDTPGKTRFDIAVREASAIADGLRQDQRMTVIAAGSTVTPVISRSESRYDVRAALEGLKCGLSGADLENALVLARSMQNAGETVEIRLYTDSDLITGETDLVIVNTAKSRENAAIINLSCGKTESGAMALSVVENFGKDREITLEMLCDGVLTDAKNVECPEGTPVPVYWKNIPEGTKLVTVRTASSDILPDDDSLSAAIPDDSESKALVVSESGFFIQKAISAVSGLAVYMIDPENWTDSSADGYDLCVFDSFVPEKLPSGCPCWMINPTKETEGLVPVTTLKGSTLSAAPTELASELGEYMNLPSVILARFSEAVLDDSWETAFLCGEYPAAAAKKSDGRVLIALLFDLHDSNLPLLKEYPILIQNMLSYSLPVMTEGDGIYETGTTVDVNILAYSVKTYAKLPDGSEVTLAPPGRASITLSDPGVYILSQDIERRTGEETKKTTVTRYLIAKIPADESAMSPVGELSDEARADRRADGKGQLELWPYIAAAVLLLLCAEWWVYCRENKL